LWFYDDGNYHIQISQKMPQINGLPLSPLKTSIRNISQKLSFKFVRGNDKLET